jgi:acyl-CoA thioester hydrolase
MATEISTSVEIQVPFHDVDPMHVAWHGHYVKYFEIARCKLLKSIQYDYPQMAESGYLWPIVELQIKYVRALEYDQKVTVKATLKEYENRIRIDYEIIDQQGERVTKGVTTQVAVNAKSREMEFSAPEVLIQNVESKLND